MRHLVIGQRQKAPNFSAFHWSPHSCLITIGQHFVTTRVVHLPKRTETSLITESDQSRANHQLLQLCTVRTAWSGSDQAVRAVHSCKSWFSYYMYLNITSALFSLFFTLNDLFVSVSKSVAEFNHLLYVPQYHFCTFFFFFTLHDLFVSVSKSVAEFKKKIETKISPLRL